jgi:hypothetical protein
MREQVEPPSSKASSTSQQFLIGRNSRGNWVVQDQSGLRGGLFVDRAEALRFALFESGRQPQAVIMVPGTLELDMGRATAAAPPANTDLPERVERKAA